MSAPSRIGERLYRRLTRLYPSDFRDRFGDEMAELFRDQLADARRDGHLATAALWLRTLSTLAATAALEHRDALGAHPRRTSMLSTLAGDLRFATRVLRKSPLFAATAVLCIALGAGAVTTVFSAMNALVLRPLPGVADPDRIVRLERTHARAEGHVSLPYAYYAHVKANARSLAGLAAWTKVSLVVRRGDAMGNPVYGNFVSGDFFRVLGVRPALGRFFLPEEDATEGTHPVIVVSERFWRSRLGADSGAVGGEVRVNGQPFTLVGVAPDAFPGTDVPIQTDAWVPLRMRRQLQPSAGPIENPNVTALQLAARLRDGTNAESAREELEALTAGFIAAGIEGKWLNEYREVRLSPLTALPNDARRTMAGFLGLLLGAAALVLLIASVNVAALLSARATARRHEMAVRAALGAGRRRLMAQLLTEILVLFALGAAGGAVLALVATGSLERMPIPGEIPIRLELSPDLRVLGFALLASLATGLVVGLAPARRAASTDIETRLRDGTAGSSTRRSLLGRSLVAGQLALSLVLLVGAGLFGRALQRGSEIDPGFSSAGVVTTPMNPESWGYDAKRARAFATQLRERLEQANGVTAVAFSNGLPLTLRSSGDNIHPRTADAPKDGLPVQYLMVGGDYHGTLRIPLRAGRLLATRDDDDAARVMVVNETLARRLQPDGDVGGVVGRTIGFRDREVTIVGVVGDTKHVSLAEAVAPLAYFPMAQHWEPRQNLLVRGTADARTLAAIVQEAMRAVDADVPRPAVTTLDDAMSIGLLPQRVAGMVTATLGAVGLLLAAVGLYGIIAYSASRRTREIGVRLALGALPGDVLRLVMREGLQLTATGVAVGLLLSAGATQLLAGLLFGVSPLDAVAYAGMSALFVAIALLASWLPARRAAKANPVSVLRGE